MTEPHIGDSGSHIATVVALKTTHANGLVAAGVEKCWSRLDPRETHDVFIVITESRDGECVARTVYAADLDDARQTHHENYADERIVEVHQSNPEL